MDGGDTGPYAFAPAIAAAVLHALWQGGLLAILAGASLSALRARSAATRHAVAMGFLGAMIAAPIATFAIYCHGPAALAPVAMAPPRYVGPLMLRGTDWLVLIIPLTWMLGASAMVVRQLGGWRVVARLDRVPAGDVPAGWRARADELRRALGIGRAVALRPGPGVSPFTARAVRPVIWLPAASWAALTEPQRDALLAHELAHVRRLDWLWNGLQHGAQALLFFHPAMWWLDRRIRQEREHACDDLAVAACGDAIALAEGLVVLERQRRATPRLALAAHGGALRERITRLLTGATTRVRAPLSAVILLCAGIVVARQVALPNDVLLNVCVDTSTSGALTPGTFHEVTADGLGAQRHYRGSMDLHGNLVERYEEDGEPRPIDRRVRAWLAELPTR